MPPSNKEVTRTSCVKFMYHTQNDHAKVPAAIDDKAPHYLVYTLISRNGLTEPLSSSCMLQYIRLVLNSRPEAESEELASCQPWGQRYDHVPFTIPVPVMHQKLVLTCIKYALLVLWGNWRRSKSREGICKAGCR